MPEAAPFTISHRVRAPRDLVWAVQTQPEHLAHWLSPEGFHNIHTAMDFRVGGRYHYGLEGPGGMQMWGLQRYLEIDPPRRIRLIQAFSDQDGGLGRHPMAATWPLEMMATTTFEDAGPGETTITITWQPHQSDDAGNATFDGARAGMQQGFGGTFAKLDAYLARLQAG